MIHCYEKGKGFIEKERKAWGSSISRCKKGVKTGRFSKKRTSTRSTERGERKYQKGK